jgi:hypothetical protein
VFFSWQIALIFIAVKGLIGAAIGFIVTVAVRRSRLTLGPALGGSLLGAVGFLIGAFVVGWADVHSAIENGRRLDFAPWGEDLRLRNWIVENYVLICLIPACLLPFLGLSIRSAFSRRQPHS